MRVCTHAASPFLPLRYRAGDDSESEIRRFNFRTEIFTVGNVENRNTCRIPRAAAQHTLARLLIMVTIIVIDVWTLTIERSVGRLCPFGDVARHVINAVTIGDVL